MWAIIIGTTSETAELANMAIIEIITGRLSSDINGTSLRHAVASTPFCFSFSTSVLVKE
jgi:hypothetical protein